MSISSPLGRMRLGEPRKKTPFEQGQQDELNAQAKMAGRLQAAGMDADTGGMSSVDMADVLDGDNGSNAPGDAKNVPGNNGLSPNEMMQKEEEEKGYKCGGAVKRLKGYATGGEIRDKAREFWKNAPQNPVSTPGQANPPSPQDAMRARLERSAQATTRVGTPTPTQPIVNQNVGKVAQVAGNVAPESFGSTAMGLQGASQVLTQPMVSNQINAGVSGLKAKAGLDPNATPFNYAKGGKVNCAEGGMIEGPGTGTSDSIPAELPVDGYVIPAAAVEAIGLDKLLELRASLDQESPQEDMGENGEEVDANVSDGEFVFTPEEVQALGGPQVLDKMVEEAMGGESMEGEMQQEPEGYAKGGRIVNGVWVEDIEQPKAQWRQDATGEVTVPKKPPSVMDTAKIARPIPAVDERMQRLSAEKFNPDTIKQSAQPPSESPLKQRLANSQENIVRQTESLRSRVPVSQPLVEPAAPTGFRSQNVNAQGVPIDKPLRPTTGGIKNVLSGLAGAGALQTQIANQVLNTPRNVEQTNAAIAGAKQKAGINNNAVPYKTIDKVASPIFEKTQRGVATFNKNYVEPAVNKPSTITGTTSVPVEKPNKTAPVQKQNQTVPVEKPAPAQQQQETGGWTDKNAIAAFQETGFRKRAPGDTRPAQALPWGYERWTNSGDAQKDAALNAQLAQEAGVRRLMAAQRQYQVAAPTMARDPNQMTDYQREKLAQDERKNAMLAGKGGGSKKYNVTRNEQGLPEYTQISGEGIDELAAKANANAQETKQKIAYFRAAMNDESLSPSARKLASEKLALLDARQ